MSALRPLAEDLWVAERPLRFHGVPIETRMTVVRLMSKMLWVHAPVALTPALRAELDALGPVRAVVAPNTYHHLYVKPYVAAYSDAFVYAAPGLEKKRRDVGFHNRLTDKPQPEWAAELDQHVVQGLRGLGEVVFFHKASRTLVLTDLLMNFPPSTPETDWRLRLMLKVDDMDGKLAFARLLRLLAVRDRAALRRSRDRILEWDFDRIVLAHGDVVGTGGKDAFRAAMAWA
ncbi:MAG: DUF4336 domain-containing protein [Candidatus Methylomirabilis sp.]|nr:DUF4336 domain-containing protein [Deltaproteobacteria bacterium]